MANKPGKEYEEIVAAIHREFGRDATVTEDVKLMGKSGKERQIETHRNPSATATTGRNILLWRVLFAIQRPSSQAAASGR